MEKSAIKCPICHGRGKLNLLRSKYAHIELDAEKIARALADKGLGVREIARIMGYKNPGSVTHLLNK